MIDHALSLQESETEPMESQSSESVKTEEVAEETNAVKSDSEKVEKSVNKAKDKKSDPVTETKKESVPVHSFFGEFEVSWV